MQLMKVNEMKATCCFKVNITPSEFHDSVLDIKLRFRKDIIKIVVSSSQEYEIPCALICLRSFRSILNFERLSIIINFGH